MLCNVCRVHLRRDFPYCLHCGSPRRRIRLDGQVPPVLVPLEGAIPEPVALSREVTTVGRERDNDVVLDDDSVSRHHAQLLRRGGGFVVADLDSLNGVYVGSRALHGDEAELNDGVTIEFGDASFRFDQPRPEGVGGRTIHGPAQTMLRAAPAGGAPEATEPLSVRPRHRSGWSLKQLPGPEEQWVLSTRSGVYLQLDARDAFIFNCIDGQSTMRDILFSYAQEYGELALPRIEKALGVFAAHGLIDGLGDTDAPERHGLRRFGHAIYRSLLRMEISVSGLDLRMGRLYRAGGWRAFSPAGVVAIWATVVLGLVAFFRAQGEQRLLDVGGAGWWGAVVVGVGYLIALVVHEMAHALAVKSYGRKVRRGGFMVMMGMPFAFVDTSDMWFGTRWSRVVVSMSGPVSTAALAGLASMGALWLPGPVAPALSFQLAYGLYMNTAYNFNPVMPLDGYQALTDAFRIPQLREQARAYFTRGLWRDIARRRLPRLRELGLALYGLAAVVGMYVFLMLGLIAWRHRLGPLVRDHLSAPWDTVVLVAVVVLVTFPVWARMATRVRTLLRGRREHTSRIPVEVAA